jgi:hypothetical protein
MKPDFNAFFRSYVDAFNRSLGAAVDVEGIRAISPIVSCRRPGWRQMRQERCELRKDPSARL